MFGGTPLVHLEGGLRSLQYNYMATMAVHRNRLLREISSVEESKQKNSNETIYFLKQKLKPIEAEILTYGQ